MSNTHQIYAPFFKNLMAGNIPNLAVVDIKCALLHRNASEVSYSFDISHETWADVKDFEVDDADYTPGGETIDNRVVELITEGELENHSVLDSTLVPKETVFTEMGSITASHAVIYYDGGATDADKLLISCVTFEAVKESSADEFKLTWHDDGILALEPDGAGGE